jgi:hypothetical protein
VAERVVAGDELPPVARTTTAIAIAAATASPTAIPTRIALILSD